jgi:hypothetical protein
LTEQKAARRWDVVVTSLIVRYQCRASVLVAPPAWQLSADLSEDLVRPKIGHGPGRVNDLQAYRARHPRGYIRHRRNPERQAGTPDADPVEDSSHGYALTSWSCEGMTYWAVSDTDPAALRKFALLVTAVVDAGEQQ